MSFLFLSSLLSEAQVPEILWASSDYKTTSGAIGPSGVVSTSTFELKIRSTETLVIESVRISNFDIFGQGMIIPPSGENLSMVKLVIYCIQKNGTAFQGKIGFGDLWLPVEVHSTPPATQLASDPAVQLLLKYEDSTQVILKGKFDRETSRYNK